MRIFFDFLYFYAESNEKKASIKFNFDNIIKDKFTFHIPYKAM